MKNIFNDNAYQQENKTKIVNVLTTPEHNYLILEENLFYPQGGGQKGDRGTITVGANTYKVINTIKNPEDPINSALLEVTETITEDLINQEAICKLNWSFRYNQMRLHTTLHFFHCLMEEILTKKLDYPKISSIKDDNTAFSQYEAPELTEEIVSAAFAQLLNEITAADSVITYPDGIKAGFRWWECKDYQIPCGGTHVKNLQEIGNIEYTYSAKKGHQTINFTLKDVI